MTDGSSQGLFVIVAVVIFGIFVVISYLLFRDKLQTGLASIFEDSITETQKNLGENIINDPIMIRKRSVQENINIDTSNINNIVINNGSATSLWEGISIWSNDMFDKNSKFMASFYLIINSGTVETIGGHEGNFSNVEYIIINGDRINPVENVNTWQIGIPYDFEKNKTYHIEFKFVTHLLDETDDYDNRLGFNIQFNRGIASKYVSQINNLKIVKL